MDTGNQVVLTTATLDKGRGEKTCRQLISKAGVGCEYFVSVDPCGQGGVKTANAGLAWALEQETDYICYVNDDVRADQKWWLKDLIEVLGSDPGYGLIAPSGRCRTKPQSKGRPGQSGYREVRQLSFFCVVFKRQLLKEIGLFDPRYVHYGCDSDYCLRAQEAGWKCIWHRGVYLEHELGPKIAGWSAKDRAAFFKRWGKQP